jgi:hypothetical protein
MVKKVTTFTCAEMEYYIDIQTVTIEYKMANKFLLTKSENVSTHDRRLFICAFKEKCQSTDITIITLKRIMIIT